MVRQDVLANNEIQSMKNIILKTVDCEKIYLFGSYAYGTPREGSDYDFYVVLNDNEENPILVAQNIYWNMTQVKKWKTPVDILTGHKSQFDRRSLQPTMERKIVRDGVLLYDR
jgi:predicted nucleotidyltransferase